MLVLGLWAFWFEPSSLRVRDESPAVPWPTALPLKVAILTDLHIGSPYNGLGKLGEIVRRVNESSPDIICLLGDYVVQDVVGGSRIAPEEIARELARLRAPHGRFAVLGNHDGWLDSDRVRRALEAAGLTVLVDAAVRVDRDGGHFWIAGLSDLWTGNPDYDRALAEPAKDDAPVLLLTHNPDVFPSVPKRVTLTLAGHTHGGQVWFPVVGRLIVPSQFGQRYAIGHIVENGRHLFVATGTGTSILPVRFMVPPEIVMLSLGRSE
jgi:predicted MPP superfamily phosphohydrolase